MKAPKWPEPEWLTFNRAALEIQKQHGGSQADAQARLRHACADEKIRSMKAPYDPNELPLEYWTRVAPNEWRDRQVDYDGPSADACDIEIMINGDDFRHWLGEPTPICKSPSKRDLAEQAINGIWPNGIPPDLLNKEIEKQVGERLKPRIISKDTILRAAGRKAN